MDEKRSENGRKGGLAVPADKRAFSQDRELAAKAGALGGSNVAPEKRSFSTNRELASQAAKKRWAKRDGGE